MMAQSTDPGRQDNRTITRTTEEARQGVTGQNVRLVLGWGLAGAIVAMAVVLSFA
jgi:hypothetical protein